MIESNADYSDINNQRNGNRTGRGGSNTERGVRVRRRGQVGRGRGGRGHGISGIISYKIHSNRKKGQIE